jgi:hypothetical protein
MDKQKRKIKLLVLFLVVVGIWLGQMAVRPMLNYLDDLDAEIARQRSQLYQDNQEIDDSVIYIRHWDYIESFLKVPEDQSKLYTYLQQMQSESEIQITNFAGFFEEDLEDHPEFRIFGYESLKFSCRLKSLVEFLARLDFEEQRLLRISRISINAVPLSSLSTVRNETEMPGGLPMDLTVEMVISIPTAAISGEQEDQ